MVCHCVEGAEEEEDVRDAAYDHIEVNMEVCQVRPVDTLLRRGFDP